MKRQKVKSSNLKSVGYDNVSELLEIEFLNGSIYQYKKVPEKLHTTLIKSDSLGKTFGLLIRPYFKGHLQPIKKSEEGQQEIIPPKKSRIIRTARIISTRK